MTPSTATVTYVQQGMWAALEQLVLWVERSAAEAPCVCHKGRLSVCVWTPLSLSHLRLAAVATTVTLHQPAVC